LDLIGLAICSFVISLVSGTLHIQLLRMSSDGMLEYGGQIDVIYTDFEKAF